MTTKANNSRRFFYPIGLISLILLPTLCIWYLDKHHAFDKFGVIIITRWSPNLHRDAPDFFPKESHPKKNYTDINLTGNDHYDKIKLDYAQLLIRELVFSQDTSTGVHFRFSDKSKYWTFIRAIDICKIEKARDYILYENDIWVLNPKPDNPIEEKPKTFVCEPRLLMTCIPLIQPEKEIEKDRKKEIKSIIDTAKTYFISGLLFITMTLLTIRRIYKG